MVGFCYGNHIKFWWLRLGIYDGTIASSSGMDKCYNITVSSFILNNVDLKREMDEEAKQMAQKDHSSEKATTDKNHWLNFCVS